MNPEYIKLAQTAYDTVLATMLEGEKQHPGNEWQGKSIGEHFRRADKHLFMYLKGDTSEDHIGHALTRLTMILALQK